MYIDVFYFILFFGYISNMYPQTYVIIVLDVIDIIVHGNDTKYDCSSPHHILPGLTPSLTQV